jgi:molybdate transport system substrate-binding protein
MKFRRTIILSTIALLASMPATAEMVRVAVAANFTAPMKSIVDAFNQQTGHTAQPVFGSSGKLYAQIMNGAPYQMFLSADSAKPEKLIEQNMALSETRFTYAKGALVLWSADEKQAPVGPDTLKQVPLQRLAIANARLAPYGRAAHETLQRLDLKSAVEDKIVTGENISQTYQFVSTRNAEFGFVALSQVIENGKIKKGAGWIVPQSYHEPIRQDAVLLKSGESNAAARALMDFLKSDTALALIRDYGYQL